MTEAFSGSASDASQASSDANVNTDINTPEGLKSGVHTEARSWNFNNKRLADAYFQLDLKSAHAYADLDLTRARNAQSMWENTYSELLKDQAEMRRRSMKQFDDANNVANSEAHRTVRHGDIAADRQWNIDEVAHLVKEILTEDQPFKDAISAETVKAIAGMTKG
jgi:hypothetical protein